MQSSGMAPQFSDGTRKTMVGCAPPKPAKPQPTRAAKPVSSHRAGGFAKHAKRGK